MKKIVMLFGLIMGVCFSQNFMAKGFINKPAENNMPAIHRLLEDAKSVNGKKLVIKIPKGDYHFYENGAFVKELYISNHDQNNPKKVAFYLENLKNLTIDAQGSKFIFHGRMLPIAVINCENIRLRNFSIDFEPTHLRQIKVISVSPDKTFADYELEPKWDYKVEKERLIFSGDGLSYQPGMAMPFTENKRMAPYDRRDLGFGGKVEDLGNHKLRIYGFETNKTSVGERYVLRTWGRPTPGIFITNSKNTVIKKVTVHYSEGMGLLAQMSENITLDGFSTCLKGKDDVRFYTTQADSTHFSGCKGKIISINGLYEGMADDAINVHGTYLKIVKRINDSTLHGRYMHGQAWGFDWGFAGDEVQFVESRKMEIFGEKNKIKSIKALDKPTSFGAKLFEIEFENPINTEISEKGNFGMENLTWTPEVYFAKNIVRNNRARAALFSTPRKVICEENFFDHVHGCAILLCGDCNGWYETGACRDVIIRKNRFKNNLTANYQFTNAVISIFPEIPDLAGQKKYFHSNIIIEDNIFETFDRPILYAKSIDGLKFKDNKIIKNNDLNPFHWNKYLFFFQRVKNVEIINNEFYEPFNPQSDMKIEMSSEDAVKFKN